MVYVDVKHHVYLLTYLVALARVLCQVIVHVTHNAFTVQSLFGCSKAGITCNRVVDCAALLV